MKKVRITLNMTIQDSLIVICGGNPGALTVCLNILKQDKDIDPDSAIQGLGPILGLDTLGIYEYRIWMLYKDVCGESIEKMLGVLRANQLGFVTANEIHIAIDNRGEGIDVESLFTQVQKSLPKFARSEEKIKVGTNNPQE